MANRTTITLTQELSRLNDAKIPPGDSLTERLSVVTRRYFTLVGASMPTLAPDSWKAAIETALQIDTRHPLAHNALLGLIRTNKADSKLAYGVDSLTTAHLYAIIHVAETVAATLGPGPYTLEQLEPFLPSRKVGP